MVWLFASSCEPLRPMGQAHRGVWKVGRTPSRFLHVARTRLAPQAQFCPALLYKTRYIACFRRRFKNEETCLLGPDRIYCFVLKVAKISKSG